MAGALGSSVSSAHGSVILPAIIVIALLPVSWALAWGMGVATFVALGEGFEGILMDGGH